MSESVITASLFNYERSPYQEVKYMEWLGGREEGRKDGRNGKNTEGKGGGGKDEVMEGTRMKREGREGRGNGRNT